jgi:RNA polymerase sigma-70 factor (ECF subfamily)
MSDKQNGRILWMEKNLLPHEAKIRHWLNRGGVSDEDVDDIIQETYARIGSVEDLECIRSPRNYAYQVARSILLNNLRRPNVVAITKNGDLTELHVASLDADPEQRVAFKDEVQEVVNAIAALPRRTRDVLLLRRVEGLSQRETANRLAIAEKTVEAHFARATHALMEQFGRGRKSLAHTSNPEEDVVSQNSERDDKTD